MLAIFFIDVQMLALKIAPKHGNPQRLAQKCFYDCTALVYVQTTLVTMRPFCTEGECKESASESEIVFIMVNQSLTGGVSGIRYLAYFAPYGGFTAVICSVFLIYHLTDVSLMPPILLVMQYVTNLILQYFIIYLILVGSELM